MRAKLYWFSKNGRDRVRQIIAAADAARDCGQWMTAAAAYYQALQVQADLQPIWVQYGNMLKEAEQFDQSEAAYQEALRLVPDDADAHLMYGHLLKITNRLEEAAVYYRVSAILAPNRPDAHRELIGLDKQGIRGAQTDLLQRTWPLNARLAAIRTQIAEALADIKKGEMGGAGTSSPHNREYLATLNAAHDSIIPLMRNLRGMPPRQAIEAMPTDVTLDSAQKLSVIFDASDLIQFFRDHRLPTGIQRVQMETIYAGLIQDNNNVDLRVCCFTESYDYWREIPLTQFIKLCELSAIGNDCTAPDWVFAMSELEASLSAAPDFVFPRDAYLVNIGTSWWLQNYFLYIREGKTRHKIKYIPFVHDMIPIMATEHCVKGLTQDFISWALGVFFHADYYIVNSEATRRDLHTVASKLGYEVNDDRIHTVRLDANFRKGEQVGFDPTLLLTHRLRPGGYVLFVSTIESRKNHLAAFGAWIRLCKTHGAENIPTLVCVGYRGWLNDPVYARLASSAELSEKVTMLSGVSDQDLARLYQSCLFTLFPSSYEGWGLPVTESLCYGKVPVISDSSSLPEAGGEFADYFELGNENQLVATLERLMFDAEYRRGREALIRQKWRPRNWQDITNDIIGTLEKWRYAESLDKSKETGSLPVGILGRYYGLNRNTEVKIYRSMASGEVFRTGNGWWGCDDWGCWTKPASARMALRVAEGAGEYRLYLGLRSAPEKDTPYDVAVSNCAVVRGIIKKEKTKWIWFDFKIIDSTDSVVDVVLQGYETGSYRSRPDEEPRTVALGVIGFMLCRQDDAASRANFIEAVALENLDQLARFTPGLDSDRDGRDSPLGVRVRQNLS
jgi:glycosyltransferase involved in cell wall biosynthesis/Tfp pilus assembly protein PilF